MKDITDILKRALNLKGNYNFKMAADEIEKISDIWCRLEDDSNLGWYLISADNGKTVVKYYGCLCEKFYERLSCSLEVLLKYIDTSKAAFIDDSF